MVSFDVLYSQFLTSISSYTLAQMSDEDIKAELFNFARRAIEMFKFPKVKLTYHYNEDESIYFFDNEVTQKEFNVILSYMKVVWIDFIISKEERFNTQYYDSSIRTFSTANLLAQLNRLYENLLAKARDEEYEYGRVGMDGRPRVGSING